MHDRFIPCYSIVPMDRQERDKITAALNRCKGLHVKVEQVFGLYAWTCTIYVFDLAEWEAQQERSRREWAMQALGVDIQTIQSIVGHADTEMTEHYLHVQESIRQSAIQLFSEAFSA